MYTVEDGAYLIRLARETIEKLLREDGAISLPEEAPEKLKEKAGVFVTLQTYPEHALRGCIGYPEPSLPLVEATVKAAVSAACEDPRFPPLLEGELENTLIEVTVLTPPELIEVASPKDYAKSIEIGRDGLIIEKGWNRGLLLPQVPVDQGWSREEFLSYACMKAGLMSDCWLDEDTKVYKFKGVVFTEVEPGGDVKERSISTS
ncbi:TIGR00296 family protein [archaeon]|nr:TIGR00296 family protein [archaeon]